METLKIFCIHSLDTPPNMSVSKEDLEHWHMAPRDIGNGQVVYLGKTYNSREELPDNEMQGVSIKRLTGRGWDRLGYSVLFKRDGTHEIITPYDDDDIVESDEKTWGSSGINSKSRHLALEGGKGAKWDDDFFDHFTDAQFLDLQTYLKTELYIHPDVKVAGHNQFSSKACPGFQVSELMELYDLSKYAYING